MFTPARFVSRGSRSSSGPEDDFQKSSSGRVPRVSSARKVVKLGTDPRERGRRRADRGCAGRRRRADRGCRTQGARRPGAQTGADRTGQSADRCGQTGADADRCGQTGADRPQTGADRPVCGRRGRADRTQEARRPRGGCAGRRVPRQLHTAPELEPVPRIHPREPSARQRVGHQRAAVRGRPEHHYPCASVEKGCPELDFCKSFSGPEDDRDPRETNRAVGVNTQNTAE